MNGDLDLWRCFWLPANAILNILFGMLFLAISMFLIIINIPFSLYRRLIIFAAKKTRPDLGDIVSNVSAVLGQDYVAKTNPRSNIVLALICEGSISVKDIEKMVKKMWIHNNFETYRKFRQYPVKWMGFLFWKHIVGEFQVEKHVSTISSFKQCTTEEELENILERLVNRRFPEKQSPWQIFIINNYKLKLNPEKPHYVLVTRWHHCLSDGTGMAVALFRMLTMDPNMELKMPNIQPTKGTKLEKLWFALTLPHKAGRELINVFLQHFVHSPYKVPDSKKMWYQVYAKSDPVSINTIKHIKNVFGVSFTSILISCFSAALSKISKENPALQHKNSSIFCCNIIPKIGAKHRQVLTNFATAALFDLPVGDSLEPKQRVHKTHDVLQAASQTVIPYLFYEYLKILGCQLNPICRLLSYNSYMPIGK